MLIRVLSLSVVFSGPAGIIIVSLPIVPIISPRIVPIPLAGIRLLAIIATLIVIAPLFIPVFLPFILPVSGAIVVTIRLFGSPLIFHATARALVFFLRVNPLTRVRRVAVIES
ncbi:hypothetical protein F4825DRAFT_419594 [Nemania diffusa]|nr:hypothetical protein F4825DRAFT_419594 [Nemania diffusa]